MSDTLNFLFCAIFTDLHVFIMDARVVAHNLISQPHFYVISGLPHNDYHSLVTSNKSMEVVDDVLAAAVHMLPFPISLHFVFKIVY